MLIMTYVLLAEKPSAAKNMAKAFGGQTGTYKGQSYRIESLLGHIMEFVEPHEMVHEDLQDDFKSWEPNTMPWNINEMNWKRQPQKTRNPKTGKVGSKAGVLKDIKKALSGATAIVIATDKDPSGEGQLIGWEVIQALGWKGDVKRIYFIDESEKELQKGFDNIEDLPNLANINQDGEFVKADVRSKWDFISMQLTRLSTHAARSQGYNTVVRQGRLKSVMTKLVADQLTLVKAYVKKPYFEVRYKDDNNNVYRRTFDPDVDTWRFADKADAEKDASNYKQSDIVQESKKRRETSPGKLLDLGGLASILTSKGYKSQEVLKTYQKMYEATIVSYPRTEDKFISHEQYNEMLPLVDKIADVVGADKALLTHRQPRKTHVKDGGAHGANRPGLKVPKSLDELTKYGPSAKAIYEILAKNFLAMFGENYVYDSIKAHVKDHPSFKATINIPVSQGFKAIFDADSETKVEDDDDDTEKDGVGVGRIGEPIVAEGVNKKPPHPTHKWLERQLGRYDVGTGATRVGTLSEVTSGKYALLTDSRGRLGLTQTGEVAAVLLEDSRIGDPKVTETLFKSMNDAGDFKVSADEILKTVVEVVKHDKEVYYRNAQKLQKAVGKPKDSLKGYVQKPKATGVYKPTGERVTFNKEWGGCTFTDDEVAKLLNGDVIRIRATAKDGNTYEVEGSLGQGEYKGKSFWGFMRKKASDYTRENAPFPASWAKYTFTKEDEQKLRNGEKINIDAVSQKGNKFNVDVSFELKEYKGNQTWGIEPHFKQASDYTSETAPFPKEWSGHVFTKVEEAKLRKGEKIKIRATSKRTGKDFDAEVTFEVTDFNGNKGWRIKPHFNGGSGGKKPEEYTRKDAPFKPEFSGYTLTKKEQEQVRNGDRVMVTATSKKGKQFTCALSLELKEFKGRKFWGLEAHFD